MRVLITGSNGMLGQAIMERMLRRKDEVHPMRRGRALLGNHKSTEWRPSEGICVFEDVDPFDAVIHLAGESVMGRWTRHKKKKIWNSRVNGFAALVEALQGMSRKPAVVVYAVGVGYYGSRSDELLTEDSPAGDSFLAELSVEMEKVEKTASDAGIRTVGMRLGTIIDKGKGTMKYTWLTFALGLGAILGDGKQWWPWISLHDAAEAFLLAVDNEELQGGVNAVAPDLVTNEQFTNSLADAMRRPVFLKIPRAVASMVFGSGFADDLLLNSKRVEPRKMQEAGFKWKYPKLDPFLEETFG